MTSPRFSPLQFPVNSSTAPVWMGVSNSPPVSFYNQDTANTVYLGYESNITQGGTNTYPLPPLTPIILDGRRTIYAVAPDGTQALVIAPGASGATAGPVATAEAIIAAGLAEQIAQAIAGSGIPLAGNPEILYQVLPATPGTALVGCTIPPSAFNNAGCYDTVAGVTTQKAADSLFCTITGTGTNNHLTITKKFWGVSDYDTTKNDLANYLTFGTVVIFCLQPAYTAGSTSGVNGGNVSVAEVAKLNTFITTIKAMGFTAANCRFVLWQEPANTGKFPGGPADYGLMWKSCGPTINAQALPAVINVNYVGAGPVTNATNYANAALGLRGFVATGTVFAALVMDFYTASYWSGGTRLDTVDANGDSISGIADANALPFGLYEVGCNPTKFGIPNCNTYLNYIVSFMATRLAAGKTNADFLYYDGDCSATGSGALSSPIGQDPSVTAPDFRIAWYQSAFTTLTSAPAFTIAGNSTKTLTPTTQSLSPVAGFAISNNLSYEIAIAIAAGAGSTNPFCTAIFNWYAFDQIPSQQFSTDNIQWSLPLGANADPNGPVIVYGSGRLRGGFMQVKITNNDTVPMSIQSLVIIGTSRVGKRDSWLWSPTSNTPVIPGFTSAQSAPDRLQIGRKESFNLTAGGGTATFLNGVFAGRATVRIFVSGATGNHVQFMLAPVPSSVFSAQNLLNQEIGTPQGGSGTAEPPPFTIDLPRAPTTMTIKNNDTVAVNVSYQIVAEETG